MLFIFGKPVMGYLCFKYLKKDHYLVFGYIITILVLRTVWDLRGKKHFT